MLRFPPSFHVTAMIHLLIFFSQCFQSVFCYIYTHHVCCIINSCICLQSIMHFRVSTSNVSNRIIFLACQFPLRATLGGKTTGGKPSSHAISRAGNPEGNFGSFDQGCHGHDICHHNSSPCHVCYSDV